MKPIDTITHVKEKIESPGPHDLIEIIMNHCFDFTMVRLLMNQYCPYRMLLPNELPNKGKWWGPIRDSKHNSVSIRNKYPTKIISEMDDNKNYVYAMLVLDRPYEKQNFVLYLSDEKIAIMLGIIYGFKIVSNEDEWKLVW